MPTTPVNEPAVTSQVVELTLKTFEPPPTVTCPVDVPVLMVVAKLEFKLYDTAPPACVIAPAEVTVKLVKLIRLVPAVVPDKIVSKPVPTLMAFEVIVAPGSVRFPNLKPLTVSVPVELVGLNAFTSITLYVKAVVVEANAGFI